MSTSFGVATIAAERARQVAQEGWTPEHDDEHTHGEMARAGAAYALAEGDSAPVPGCWPWSADWWKPGDGSPESRMRCLAKAGALIAAELDRMHRTGTGVEPTIAVYVFGGQLTEESRAQIEAFVAREQRGPVRVLPLANPHNIRAQLVQRGGTRGVADKAPRFLMHYTDAAGREERVPGYYRVQAVGARMAALFAMGQPPEVLIFDADDWTGALFQRVDTWEEFHKHYPAAIVGEVAGLPIGEYRVFQMASSVIKVMRTRTSEPGATEPQLPALLCQRAPRPFEVGDQVMSLTVPVPPETGEILSDTGGGVYLVRWSGYYSGEPWERLHHVTDLVHADD